MFPPVPSIASLELSSSIPCHRDRQRQAAAAARTNDRGAVRPMGRVHQRLRRHIQFSFTFQFRGYVTRREGSEIELVYCLLVKDSPGLESILRTLKP